MTMESRPEYRAVFVEEAHEHLEEWESALLELEQRPDDPELVNQMFRAIHTLKGSAGFIGFEKLQQLNHDLENRLQEVREGKIRPEGAIIELLFGGLDLSRRMVDSFNSGEVFEEDIEPFLARLDSASLDSSTSAEPVGTGAVKAGEAPTEGQASPAGEHTRRFVLSLNVTAEGREAYLRCFLLRSRIAPAATIVAEDPAPETMKDLKGGFRYQITVASDRDAEAIRELINVDQVEIESIEEIGSESTTEEVRVKVGGEERTQASSGGVRADEVVRVSVERLDNLLNLVGELVIHNSSFQNIADRLKVRFGRDPSVLELNDMTEGLSKIARSLQDGIMKVRMLPVNNVFARFHRVVRDLAKSRGKEITLDVFGEETEIDKKVMDRIADPLVHLVRNAVDHGIEDSEGRKTSGKAAVGLVRLGAFQDGDHICIEVSDDGGGIDRDAVLRKATERGLVDPNQTDSLGDEEVFGLIFRPGFSTADQITEISGRGVGMDVVKQAIDSLGGNVRVRSFPGKGTTVTISLPLTMAIISALLVDAEDLVLAIPLSAVREVLRLDHTNMGTIGRQRVVRIRDTVVPVVDLAEALALSAGNVAIGMNSTVVIVDYEGRSIGLAVDRVVGTREIVIKSLRKHYREIDGLIGASILGNGSIALIIDVEAMVTRFRNSALQAEIDRFQPSSIVERHRAPKTPISEPAPRKEESTDPALPAATEEIEITEPSRSEQEIPMARSLESTESELFSEINNTGAIQASQAMTQMTGQDIRVSFPESELVAVAEVADFLGGEELPVGGIYVGLNGEITGGILLVFPQRYLFRFYNLLLGRPVDEEVRQDDMDLSSISEMANILSASFANAISDATELRVMSTPPELSIDMCGSVVDSVLARFNEPGDEILLTKVVLFMGDTEQVACDLLVFLEPDSLQRLLDSGNSVRTKELE